MLLNNYPPPSLCSFFQSVQKPITRAPPLLPKPQQTTYMPNPYANAGYEKMAKQTIKEIEQIIQECTDSPHRQLRKIKQILQGSMLVCGNYLQPISKLGEILFSDGTFHILWIHVVSACDHSFSKLQYHSQHAEFILKSRSKFDKALISGSESALNTENMDVMNTSDQNTAIKTIMENLGSRPVPKSIFQDEKESSQEQQEQEEEQEQQDDEFSDDGQKQKQNYVPLPIVQSEISSSKKLFPITTTTKNDSEDESEQLTVNKNLCLVSHNQLNQRRVSAQIVCQFYGITNERTFSYRSVTIQKVLQTKKQSKFEYAVVLAKIKQKQSQAKVMINCYKFINLEQLMRIQMTYSKIYGFICYSYDVDFYRILHKVEPEYPQI